MPILSQPYQIKPSQPIQSSSSLLPPNTIVLKNQQFYPQYIKISTSQSLTIKVSYNNNYSLSQYNSSSKKYIFAIEQLQQQSSYLSQGQQYIFNNKFNNPGEYQIVCINLPKIKAKIIVEKCISQQSESICDQIEFDTVLLGKQQLILKSPIKLQQVKQQYLEQQLKDHQEQDQQHNKQYQRSPSLCPKSHQSKQSQIQYQYQRILTQEDNQSLSLQNKYLKYFKQQFKLWRNFFQQKQKKDNLKSKHTKNLSLSQVKQIQQKNILYDQSVQSDSQNLSSMGKNISIASQLYSHQEIIDRGYQQDINSSKKQMKKTNSQYGFNITRDNNDTPDLLEKIKSFEKQQIKVNLNLNLNINLNHSRRSDYIQDKKQNNNNQKVKSINRTQANSPMLKQSKKENNFITWAQEWAIEKQYSQVKINKKNDQYLLNQCMTFMKNKYNVSKFLYC